MLKTSGEPYLPFILFAWMDAFRVLSQQFCGIVGQGEGIIPFFYFVCPKKLRPKDRLGTGDSGRR